jgi:hypothetical protein
VISRFFKKLLEKMAIFFEKIWLLYLKMVYLQPLLQKERVIMNQINSESCVGCQLLGHCGSVCETSETAGSDSTVWGKLLMPCVLLLAVVLLVGASYLINQLF